jgi:hypothetical protein
MKTLMTALLLVTLARPAAAQSLTPALVTLGALRAADASLTWDLAHRFGGKELNPFMPQNPKLIVTVMAAETVAQTWALAKVSAKHPKIAQLLAWASIGIEGLVVVHNARQYRGAQ